MLLDTSLWLQWLLCMTVVLNWFITVHIILIWHHLTKEVLQLPPWSNYFLFPTMKKKTWLRSWEDRWWGHICSWGLLWGSGWELLYMYWSWESKHCTAIPMEEVWGLQWRLFIDTNHIWSNSTIALQLAYKLFSSLSVMHKHACLLLSSCPECSPRSGEVALWVQNKNRIQRPG